MAVGGKGNSVYVAYMARITAEVFCASSCQVLRLIRLDKRFLYFYGTSTHVARQRYQIYDL